jgi:hypothetical protein
MAENMAKVTNSHTIMLVETQKAIVLTQSTSTQVLTTAFVVRSVFRKGASWNFGVLLLLDMYRGAHSSGTGGVTWSWDPIG